ncbi:kelch domain-containing protein 10-like [Myzus persicae]|uniref:kelch domain-containing protein 10-like n=1 Tax=Myzus persicae TaxID=13164 RepID=UPI000B930238|nr:kelch domain-containing protein 10-like [Myzus persicae]XP_022179264.1 kelch domain-containing protein 10-like [Myzus persicae]XP_022179265.1 kelch domain-containing protein 10-like [Myzus persicae]XP_022179266.1 kelch domain-containing protein 10-like [Myzus persicae]
MTSLEYRFKHLVFDIYPKNPPEWHRPLCVIDQGIACNDDYLFKYNRYRKHKSEVLAVEALKKYNFIADRWETIKCMNLPTYFNLTRILMSGNLIIVHGGKNFEYINEYTFRLFIGNLSKKNHFNCVQFEEIYSADGIPIITEYGQPVHIEGKFVYFLNGTSEYQNEMDVYRLDLCTKKWQLLCQACGQHPRTDESLRREVAYYDDHLYTFGGVHVMIQHKNMFLDTFEKIQVFDISTNKWQYFKTLPDIKNLSSPYPANRCYYGWAQCVTQPEYVYMSGGSDNLNFFSDIWRLNLNTLQWCNLMPCKLPKSMFLHSSTVVPSGRIYFHNGIVSTDSINVHQKDDILCAWVKIPKLIDICWDAMLYYFKNQLFKLSIEDLENLGLPSEYYERIIKAKTLV